VVAATSSVGCDQGSPAPLDVTGPPLHVVWTYPPNEAAKVPLTFTIRVQFDRFLMPSTAVREALCLQPASVGGDNQGTDRCVGAGFVAQYDPVDRVASWVIRGVLVPETRYNVRLFAPKDVHDTRGVRAFDGATLEREFTFAFTTGNDGPGLEPRRAMDFCAAKELCPLPAGACDGPMPIAIASTPHDFLAQRCSSTGNCHGPGPHTGGLSGATLRLDDGTPDGLVAAVRHLVDRGVVATETATGIDPAVPSRNVLAPFGRNMPYIDPAHPGNSYLLYKLILAMAPRCPYDPDEESATRNAAACTFEGEHARWIYAQDFYGCDSVAKASLPRDPFGNCPNDGGFPELPTKAARKGELVSPLVEPRVPAEHWQPPARGEYDRLRTRIRGEGMPIGALISRAEALAISAWIADGARIESCP
jgi:Bacterial Ig-like domain